MTGQTLVRRRGHVLLLLETMESQRGGLISRSYGLIRKVWCPEYTLDGRCEGDM